MENAGRVGVLAGGDSPEREVSLVSGEHVKRALESLGHDVQLIITGELDDLFPVLDGVDVVFNCLHGGSGEDGTVQLFLDVMGIPYAGSGAQACARAMDKVQAKSIFGTMRVPTPPWLSLEKGTPAAFVDRVRDALSAPFVVKPTHLGSTIGVTVVENADDLPTAVEDVFDRHGTVLVESYIAGRELTVGILLLDGEEVPLPVIEIRTPDALFDYRAKYTDGVAEFVVPAPVPGDVAREVQAISLRAHQTLGCYGFSRVDLRMSEDGTPYVLEVNTLPGMTPISDLPRAAAAAGIRFEQLVELMLKTSIKEDG